MWQDVATTDGMSAAAPTVCVPPAKRTRKPKPLEGTPARDVLTFSREEIVRTARRHGPKGPVPVLWARRMARELLLRRLRHIPFRNSHNGEACEAYRRMGVSDFTGINVLQAWANWRTIPRNMSDVLPARPLMVVDLCCAIGQSTAVLAHYCPPGSRFLGLESSEEFVTIARQTAFRTRDGRRADAEFHAQDVLKPFGDGDGQIVRSGSVDLVNCSGAIGCHFAPQDTARLVGEVRRVLAAGGLAMLDSGREGTGARTLREIAEASDLSYLHRVRSCLADPRWQLCFRKVGH